MFNSFKIAALSVATALFPHVASAQEIIAQSDIDLTDTVYEVVIFHNDFMPPEIYVAATPDALYLEEGTLLPSKI